MERKREGGRATERERERRVWGGVDCACKIQKVM